MTHPSDITQALLDLSAGNREAMNRLLPLVYDQLHAMAERELRRERGDHTLSPTALVHEAYLKLIQLDRINWQGRAHFLGACAQSMRRILISYARMKKAGKRGAGAAHVPIDDVIAPPAGAGVRRPASSGPLREKARRGRETAHRPGVSRSGALRRLSEVGGNHQ